MLAMRTSMDMCIFVDCMYGEIMIKHGEVYGHPDNCNYCSCNYGVFNKRVSCAHIFNSYIQVRRG